MPNDKIVRLNRGASPDQPTELQYKGHKITLKYRPLYNDWQYTVHTTITYDITRQAAHYASAVRAARKIVEDLHAPDAVDMPATME